MAQDLLLIRSFISKCLVLVEQAVFSFNHSLKCSFPADYSGSLEAVVDILNSFKSDQIQLEVTSSGVGQISENDIRMAETTKGIVYGFNVGLSKDMDQLSKRLQVPVKNFSVIYKLMDDVQVSFY